MKRTSSTFNKLYYGLGRWSVFDEDHPLISEKKGGKPLKLRELLNFKMDRGGGQSWMKIMGITDKKRKRKKGDKEDKEDLG